MLKVFGRFTFVGVAAALIAMYGFAFLGAVRPG